MPRVPDVEYQVGMMTRSSSCSVLALFLVLESVGEDGKYCRASHNNSHRALQTVYGLSAQVTSVFRPVQIDIPLWSFF